MHVPNPAAGSIRDEIESQPVPEAEKSLMQSTTNGILRGGIKLPRVPLHITSPSTPGLTPVAVNHILSPTYVPCKISGKDQEKSEISLLSSSTLPAVVR